MTNPRRLAIWLSLGATAPPLAAQSVMLDQGTFEVTVDGAIVGAEDFTIRRAGLGLEAAIFANAVVHVSTAGGDQEVRPLLQVSPEDGSAVDYLVRVHGADTTDIRVSLAGRRYRAVIQSAGGEEHREFRGRPGTRILESHVAHQYYFLRDLREGSTAPVIEPRTREQSVLEVGPWTDVELQLGPNPVEARRVEFTSAAGTRIVWFDRQGRVLRVEVPSAGYVAERSDLVG